MTRKEIEVAGALPLFRHVFGMQPEQKLGEFARECSPLREDAKFIAEVREYALARATA